MQQKPSSGHSIDAKSTMRKAIFGAAAVIVLLAAAVVLGWFDLASAKVPDGIRAARIAVLPFENKTGDASLDILGDMAADWVIQGLMYLPDVQVVSFENVRVNAQYMVHEDTQNSFKKRTGAEKYIKGRYYLDRNQILFQCQIINASTGEVEMTLPTIKGPKDNQTELISKMQQKFTTAFAAKGHSWSPGIAQNPPSYEAYELYREGADIYSSDFEKSIALQNQAIQADSSFFWPYIFVAGAYFMDGEKPKADSVFALIGSRVAIDRLPRIEKQWYLHWKAILDKDLQTAYQTILKVTEFDPKMFIANLEAGIMADDINRPAEAVRIFGMIKPEHAPAEFDAYTWWHSHYAHNLYRLGQYDQAFAILDFIPPRLRQAQNYYNRLAEIHIAQKNTKELEQMMKGLLASDAPGGEKIKTFLFIAEHYGALQQPVLQKQWADRAIDWYEKSNSAYTPPSYLKGTFLYLTEHYQKALPMLQQATQEKGLGWLQMTKEGPGWLQLSRLGGCYIKLGKNDMAQATLKEMEKWYDKTQDAGYLMCQAHLYALWDEKEKALDLVKAAFKNAFPYGPDAYQNDVMLASLHGFAPFEEFVVPK